ncbi:hypothetical protein PUN28_014938 [Cardiocondyla obscurior]|uniref:Uncharacterized protein n=1 Tax=Cardiocondyla obscurior TaxID=286306 RepID=A0AAW2EYR1_9HYME
MAKRMLMTTAASGLQKRRTLPLIHQRPPRAFPATGHFFARRVRALSGDFIVPSTSRPAQSDRVRRDRTRDSPRNNNRGRPCNQRALMAPHYAKRRAKGAWHFLSRSAKNQERPAASCGPRALAGAFAGRVSPSVSSPSAALRRGRTSRRNAARRRTKDTALLGLLGPQPVAGAVRARRCHCVFLSLPTTPARPPPPARQRYNWCIDVSNLSARDAAPASPVAANFGITPLAAPRTVSQ